MTVLHSLFPIYKRTFILTLLIICAALIVSACGGNSIEATVPSPDQARTGSGDAEPTAAESAPTNTPEPAPQPTNTPDAAPTEPPTQEAVAESTASQQAENQTAADAGLVDLSGAWRFNFTLALLGTEFEGLLGFTQEGDQIQGLYTLPGLGNVGKVSGKVDGQTATLTAEQLVPCAGNFTMDVTVNPDGATLTGSYAGNSCDGPSAATFTGELMSRDAAEVISMVHPLLTAAGVSVDLAEIGINLAGIGVDILAESSSSAASGADSTQTDADGKPATSAASAAVAANCDGVRGTDFSGQSFRQHNFQGEDLRGANFSSSEFSQPNFSDANLSCANFASTDLAQPNFTNANLSGASFASSDLTQPNLTNTNLINATLASAGISGGVFSGTNLQGANLAGAIIFDVVFKDVNLKDANLSNADLVNMRWENTTCPDGTNSDDNGEQC